MTWVTRTRNEGSFAKPQRDAHMWRSRLYDLEFRGAYGAGLSLLSGLLLRGHFTRQKSTGS